ncbi:MAG: acetate--CoA ligase family protein [Patescibacteria group bacterium]
MFLNHFFRPKAVAIVGASNDSAKIGRQVLDNIIKGGFKGKVYPINLKEKKIAGLKAYASLADLPLAGRLIAADRRIDSAGRGASTGQTAPSSLLVLIVIPAPFVLDEVKKCAALGIKNIIIISAGFREDGQTGKKREEELVKIAAENKLNILGPNCLGFINSHYNLNASFGQAKREKGNIALLSQSGAVGSAALDWIKDKSFNLGYFVSLGNKAVLDENDFLKYIAQDKNIDLIILYLEGIKQGKEFMALVSRLVKRKPILVLPAGSSKAGRQMVRSHSGALTGFSGAFHAGLKRSGAIELDSLEEIFNLSLFRSEDWQSRGNSDLYLITNAGGPAVLTADEAGRQGLTLAGTQDILGDAPAARYQQAINKTLARSEVNNLLVLLTPQTSTEPLKTAEAIVAAARRFKNKTIMASFIGGQTLQSAKELLNKNHIPSFDYPEEAVGSFKHLSSYRALRSNIKPYNNPEKIKFKPIINTDYAFSFQLLKKYGIPVVKVRQYEESELNSYDYPAVLKIVGPDFLHKSDKGGVVINLKNPVDLRRAALKLKAANLRALKKENNYLIVQPQAVDFQEIILGFKRDASFGPIMMIGQGGIYTEIFKDFCLAVSDLSIAEAHKLIRSLKIFPILNGARGQKKYDLEALARSFINLARLANEHPEISELDINPLFVKEKGIIAGDVRIIL